MLNSIEFIYIILLLIILILFLIFFSIYILRKVKFHKMVTFNEIAALSSAGRVRKVNEDSVASVILDIQHGDYKSKSYILAVADGMGGHKAGDIASRIAINTIVKVLSTKITDLISKNQNNEEIFKILNDAFESANKNIFKFKKDENISEIVGAALSTGIIIKGKLFIAHAGDTRVYLVRRKHIKKITRDHRLVEELIIKGELTPEEALTHPSRHVITNAIGVFKDLHVDQYLVRLENDDYIIFCSDGLTDVVKDHEIKDIVLKNKIPKLICDTLVNLANERGGKDNISVVVLKWREK